jgi:hypothetical protein
VANFEVVLKKSTGDFRPDAFDLKKIGCNGAGIVEFTVQTNNPYSIKTSK